MSTPTPAERAATLRTRYEFINFEKAETSPTRKTPVYNCRNNRSGDVLGIVSWYGAWRQYCYFPSEPAVYSAGCLRDIEQFISQLKGGAAK